MTDQPENTIQETPVANEASLTPTPKNNLLKQIFKRRSSPISAEPKPESDDLKWWQKSAFKKRLKIGLIVVAVLVVLLGSYTAVIVSRLKTEAATITSHSQAALDQFKGQDLLAAEQELIAAQASLASVDSTYHKLAVYNFIPLLRNYYQDGLHGLNAAGAGMEAAVRGIKEIAPYADVLGFTGEGSFSGGTAEDRIRLIIDTLGKVMPAFDEIANNLEQLRLEVLAINPNRYPKMIVGYELRSMITNAQESIDTGVEGFLSFRPVLEQLPEIAGGTGERKKYLILFQNDNELRPTGGFLTAYAVVYVEDGKVTPEKSDDIYELDQKFYERITIPESLGKYLTTEKYWNLRDMNISPDFKLSMEQFYEHYQNIPGEPDDIDGIIAVDTKVLTDLLAILGPVGVGEYGTFSAEPDERCDGCAQVVYALSEIITKPTPYHREDRKGILGPLMQSTLQKAYSAPKELWPQLFQAMWSDIQGKHIQMYFLDDTAQTAAEAVNGAGRLMATTEGADFLAIVDANLGGAKSNLFTEYDVKQVISPPENGVITKTVEITYKNTRKADNCNLEAGQLCLNSTLRDWSRLYIPAGSELIEAQGFTTEPSLYEENGLAVIDGFFILEPLGTAKLKITYTVPYTNNDTYVAELWKQGGIDGFDMLLDVAGWEEQLSLTADTVVEIPF